MKLKHLKFGKGFRVAIGNSRSQAAEMVIPPGDAEGRPAKPASAAPINGSTSFPAAALRS
jgi:hypothetical protein